MTEIFREVDEELRRERMGQLARRYGPMALAAVALALAAALIAVWWNNHQQAVHRQEASAFLAAQALLDAGKAKEAAEAFAKAADDSGAGYPTLARFEEAEARIQSGDTKGAIAAYDRIAAKADDSLFRQLAEWKAALLLVGTAPREEIEKRLAPLLDEHNPFRHSAREVRAAAALRANDRDTAVAMLQQLAEDLNAPRGLRRRAADTLTALGVAPKVSEAEPSLPQSGLPE